MIKINLLPKEVQERGKGVEWVFLGTAVLFIFAAVALFSYMAKKKAYEKDLARKARWNQQLEEMKAKVAQVAQLDAQKNVLNAKKNTVVQLLQGRLLYPKFMEQFFETVPKDVWISDFKLTEDGSKNIKVEAMSNSLTIESIADWLQTLESKPESFAEPTLSAIDQKTTPDNKSNLYGFTMTFTYKPPPLGV